MYAFSSFSSRTLGLGLSLTLGLSAISMTFPATLSTAQAAAGWEDMGVIDNVRVSRKQVSGSDVFAFKGVTIANVSIGKLLGVFLDRDQRKYWVDRYDDHKTLELPTPFSEVYWIKFDLPFPVSDRDYVLEAHSVIDETHRTFRANIKSVVDPRAAVNDCCVRAQAYGTYYVFQALPGVDKTRITVEVNTNPMGMLPDWLVNLIQKKWPSKTLNGLIHRANRADQKAKAEFVDWHTPRVAAPVAPAPDPTAPAPSTPAPSTPAPAAPGAGS